MKFTKYPEIEGSWRIKEIEYLRLKGLDHPTYKWTVTEKVHGSNLALYVNKDEVKIAKRGSFINDTENFSGINSIREELIIKAQKIYDHLVDLEIIFTEAIIYGEIYGGLYDHPDVAKQSVKRCQKGVQYRPDIGFYIFDVCLDGHFYSADFVEKMCYNLTNDYAKVLFKGTFDECLNFPIDFDSKIPEQLGLPPITDNICEGVVIRPMENMTYDSSKRVIFKNKNAKFLEKAKATRTIHEPVKELSEEGKIILTELSKYVTENRLRNVLSKIGSFTKKEFVVVFNAFKKDVYEEFNKDNYDFNLSKPEKQVLDKILGQLLNDVWRPIFLAEAE